MADEMEKNEISQGEVQDAGSEAAHAAPRAPTTPSASRSRSPRGPRRPGMTPIIKFTDVQFCHQCGHFVGFGMRSECNADGNAMRMAIWTDIYQHMLHADGNAIMDQDRHGRHRAHSTPPSSKMGGWSVACCSKLQ